MPEKNIKSAKEDLFRTGNEIIETLKNFYVQDKNGDDRSRVLIWKIAKITFDSAVLLERFGSNADEETSISAIVLSCFQAISDQLKQYHYISGESLSKFFEVPEKVNRQVQDAEFMQELKREQWQIHFRLAGILEVCATDYMTAEEKNGKIRNPH